MKKFIPTFLCVLALNSTFAANALAKDQQSLMPDPFVDDPFFQSQKDIMGQMQTMQKAMDQLIQSHFSKINHIANRYSQQPFGSDSNVEIKENSNELVYKIKLPQGTDNKVDVTVKNGHLVLSLNATQKITHEQDNAKSVSYSQSNYSQSFQLPPGYDLKSMHTNIKDSNLIVTFKKLRQAVKVKNLKNVF